MPVPVVSVGNLTVGGTGKSPVVVWLAEALEARGYVVAVLSRGYGRRSRGVHVVASGGRVLVDVEVSGDEPAMIGRRLQGPVVVGERRVAAAREAVERGATVLLLDDGFQHRALARDFDVLLLDGERPLGNGWLLPAGPLREPAGALARATAVVTVLRDGEAGGDAGRDDAGRTRAPETEEAARNHYVVGLAPASLARPDGDKWIEEPLGRLAGRRILAVVGVARPEGFYRMLRRWGGRMVNALEFPDHHWYDRGDFAAIRSAAREADIIVTTEKDLVKLERFPFARGALFALRVRVVLPDTERLLEEVTATLGRRSGT
jgi:tetraacyldisaccharide 4'-kinase